MACIAIPGEQGQMTVHSSTQHPSEVQTMVAEVLGVPFNQVIVHLQADGRRIRWQGNAGGPTGDDGGACWPRHTRRPVRFVYNKDDDMRFTGKRHPFKVVYKAGFDDDGRITAVDVELYSNGGCSTDLVVRRARAGDAASGQRLLSAQRSDHGPGLPNQSAEQHRLPRLRRAAGRWRNRKYHRGNRCRAGAMDALDVRQANCYGIEDRNVTPYGQMVRNNTLPELFATVAARMRLRRAAARNRPVQLRDRQRTCEGMALSAVKFGISFTRRTMNQANALVNIYLDGRSWSAPAPRKWARGSTRGFRQIVADELGIGYDQRHHRADQHG